MKDQHNTNWRRLIVVNVAFWLCVGLLMIAAIAVFVTIAIRGGL